MHLSDVYGAAGAEIEGVLFDIDDTLVDLEQAMGRTLQAIDDPALRHLSDDDWKRYTSLYSSDPQQHYDRFLAGEITFAEQRVHRVRHARAGFTQEQFIGEAAESWMRAYDETLPVHFQAYDDVVPLLDALDERAIAYGAVSNNVHDYQRIKLDLAGLRRIRALVGIDAVGVAKPEPAIYHEGARLIGTAPGRTLYVGDNRVIDGLGALAAGLWGVWLDRKGSGGAQADDGIDSDPGPAVPRITGLAGVLQFLPSVR